jgi:DNA-binding response OmpR family regulator
MKLRLLAPIEWGLFSETSRLSEGNTQARLFRFGMFELDSVTGELRKDGKSWPRIRDQALQILIMLLEKSDEVVGRDELRERLWPSDTFVDFDHGVNAINQVRTALGDSAVESKIYSDFAATEIPVYWAGANYRS